MSNMSYTRFENTYEDLKDCYDTLLDFEIKGLSDSERRYAYRLISLCKEIADEFEETKNEHLL